MKLTPMFLLAAIVVSTSIPAAALSIDPDDGGLVIDEYDGEPGRLIDVQQTR